MNSTNLIPSITARNERPASRSMIWALAIAACVVVDAAVVYGLFALGSWILDVSALRSLIVPVIGLTVAGIAVASTGRRAWHRGMSFGI